VIENQNKSIPFNSRVKSQEDKIQFSSLMRKKQTNQFLQFGMAHMNEKPKEMKNTRTDAANLLVCLALLWD
jgi:hypothetical protein